MSETKVKIDPFKVKRRVEPAPKPVVQIDERLDPLTPTATLQIYDYIAAALGREKQDTHVNRASSASRCHKQRWYQRNGFPGEPLTPRTIVNFALGDMTEHAVKYFIHEACVGPGNLYSEVDFGVEVGEFTIQNGYVVKLYSQPDLIAKLGDIEVTAHVDGWGKRSSDGLWELIEVKSAADRGFTEFQEQGPGDYLKQAMVNLETDRAKALGAVGVRYFYLKKNTGHLWDRYYPKDADLLSDVIEEYKIASQPMEPRAPYVAKLETYRGKPTGRKVLPWQCAYCPYTEHCHPSAEIEFKNGKPIYVVKEKV